MNEQILDVATVPQRITWAICWITVLARHSRHITTQRNKRRAFVSENGFSTSANDRCGGKRLQILARDGYKCVQCGMTDAEHKEKWGRPITVDHRDKNRKNNTDENLQTLCLSCHGRKDITQRLVEAKVFRRKGQILAMRQTGATYQEIADASGFSIGAVWKWVQRWRKIP